MKVHGQQLDRSELLAHVGQLSQVAGVRLVELADGSGRGTRLLEFRSGAGLEPSTNGVAGRQEARAKGELVMLEPGQSRAYDVVIDAISGSNEVAEHLKRHG